MASFLRKHSNIHTLKKQLTAYFNENFSDLKHGGCVLVYHANCSTFTPCYSTKQATNIAAKYIQSSGCAFASVNEFKKLSGGKQYRIPSNLWGLSHIVIDIDAKKKGFQSVGLNEFVAFLKMDGVPDPTGIVSTGSGGYHLYWGFERLPASMAKSVQALKMKLCDILIHLEDTYEMEGLKVDLACTDVSRIVRLPGSFHMCNDEQAEYVRLRRPYRFKTLANSVLPRRWNYDFLMANIARSIRNFRAPKIAEPKPTHPLSRKTPEALAEYRLGELMRLANDGYQFHGCRERACFLVRNNAAVLGWDEEKTMAFLRNLNENCFYAALPERELVSCSKARKHYKMTNETILTYLNLDGSTEYFSSARKKKGRKEKSEKILSLIESLVRVGESIRQIASKLGLSISLVKRRRAQLSRRDPQLRLLGLKMQGIAVT